MDCPRASNLPSLRRDTLADDHTAAREVLREQAFAYVERLEREVGRLKNDLAAERTAHHRTNSELESTRGEFEVAIGGARFAVSGNFEGGLLQGLEDEAERSLKLKRAVEAALVNLRGDGVSGALASSSLSAARRNLTEGLRAWNMAGHQPDNGLPSTAWPRGPRQDRNGNPIP